MHYPHAEKIVLVMDNLNMYSPAPTRYGDADPYLVGAGLYPYRCRFTSESPTGHRP